MSLHANPLQREVDRDLERYRRLLVLYPKPFRSEWSDEMVETFRELLVHHAGGRGAVWRRVVRDLVTSAARERGAAALHGSRSSITMFVVLAGLLVLAVTGRPGWVALPFAAMIVAPAFGFGRLHRAWVMRRTTGELAWGTTALGMAAFAPAIAFAVQAGPDRAWLVMMTLGLTAIAGSIVGALWAITTLVETRRSPEEHASHRRRARLVIAAGVLVLGTIVGASYHSYLKSQPPPGDHSVANASADSRALWEAAYQGDLDEVRSLTEACADPFVQFSGHGLTDFRARSAAEHRSGGWGNTDPAPDAVIPTYEAIIDHLHDAEDRWLERCGT